jgi:hypothetical protein
MFLLIVGVARPGSKKILVFREKLISQGVISSLETPIEAIKHADLDY